MQGNYSHLDEILTAVKFKLPPIPTGMYEVIDDFDTKHSYHFRRMPRARKYMGRFGLWYHHPDAQWLLVGRVNDQNHFQMPVELLKEYDKFLSLFLLGKRTLVEARCAWCGRKTSAGEGEIHQTETCQKNAGLR
jgi:hypothetical protein